MALVNSYTAANQFPAKLIQILDKVDSKNLKPIHLNFIPTNVCNLKCEFCSCRDVDKNKSMSSEDLDRFFSILDSQEIKTVKSVTITGGGEPLLHPNIGSIIDRFYERDIEIGLVTNGVVLAKKHDNPYMLEMLEKLTWCRISMSDDRTFLDYDDAFHRLFEDVKTCDFGFSYVVTSRFNVANMYDVIALSNVHDNVTHVRLVPDLYDLDNVPSVERLKVSLDLLHINLSKTIIQERQSYTKGNPNCFIGLVKPVIDCDMQVYACCGSQYAVKHSDRKMHSGLCYGDFQDFMSAENKPINGNLCDVCYYDDYNSILNIIKEDLNHVNFI